MFKSKIFHSDDWATVCRYFFFPRLLLFAKKSEEGFFFFFSVCVCVCLMFKKKKCFLPLCCSVVPVFIWSGFY